VGHEDDGLADDALEPEQLVLEALARDGNGRQTKPARGRSLVDFTVKQR